MMSLRHRDCALMVGLVAIVLMVGLLSIPAAGQNVNFPVETELQGAEDGGLDVGQANGNTYVAVAGDKTNADTVQTGLIVYDATNDTVVNFSSGATNVGYDGDLQWADVTGDGNDELIVTGAQGNSETGTPQFIIYGFSNSSLQKIHEPMVADSNIDATGLLLSSLDVEDYDADGEQEIAVIGADTNIQTLLSSTSVGQGRTMIWDNDGDGQETFTLEHDSRGNSNLRNLASGSIRWVDWNGDGNHGLITTGVEVETGEDSSAWSRHATAWDANFSQINEADSGVRASDVDVLDIDDDGKDDYIAYMGRTSPVPNDDPSGYFTRLIRNNNIFTGDIQEIVETQGPNAFAEGDLDLHDADHDGEPELAIQGLTKNDNPSVEKTLEIVEIINDEQVERAYEYQGFEDGVVLWNDLLGTERTDLLVTGQTNGYDTIPFRVYKNSTANPDWSSVGSNEIKGIVKPPHAGGENVGIILDGDQLGVPGDSFVSRTTTTDSENVFTFSGISQDQYQVEVEGFEYAGEQYEWTAKPLLGPGDTVIIRPDTGAITLEATIEYNGTKLTQGQLGHFHYLNNGLPLRVIAFHERKLNGDTTVTWPYVPPRGSYSESRIEWDGTSGPPATVNGDSVATANISEIDYVDQGTKELTIPAFGLAELRGVLADENGNRIIQCATVRNSNTVPDTTTYDPEVCVSFRVSAYPQAHDPADLGTQVDLDDAELPFNRRFDNQDRFRVKFPHQVELLTVEAGLEEVDNPANESDVDFTLDPVSLDVNQQKILNDTLVVNTSSGRIQASVADTQPIDFSGRRGEFYTNMDGVLSYSNDFGITQLTKDVRARDFLSSEQKVILGGGNLQLDGTVNLFSNGEFLGQDQRFIYDMDYVEDEKESSIIFGQKTRYVPSGGDTISVNFAQDDIRDLSSWGTVKGQLTTSDGNKTHWNEATLVMAYEEQSGSLHGLGSPDNEGAYLIPGLSADKSYRLVAGALDDQGNAYLPTESTGVGINAGQETTRDIQLERGSIIRPTVQDSNGNTIDGARVELADPATTRFTDAGGTVVLAGLQSGTYKLEISKNNFQTKKVTVDLGADEQFDTTVTLAGDPGNITGNVESSGGTAIAGIPVRARSQTSDFTRETETGSSGNYELSGLPSEDTYSVVAGGKDVNSVGYKTTVKRDVYVAKNDTVTESFAGGDALSAVLRIQANAQRVSSNTFRVTATASQSIVESATNFCEVRQGANSLTGDTSVGGEQFIYDYNSSSDTQIAVYCQGSLAGTTKSDTFELAVGDISVESAESTIDPLQDNTGNEAAVDGENVDVEVPAFAMETENGTDDVTMNATVRDTEADGLDDQVSDVADINAEVPDASDTEPEINNDIGVTVSIAYDTSELPQDPSDVNVFFYNETTEEWSDSGIRNVSLDKNNQQIEFETTHFTLFSAAASSSGSGSSAGGGGCIIQRAGAPTWFQDDLRQSRDSLLDTSIGRWITQTYYNWFGPGE